MNLIGDPWIPVVFADGIMRQVSLQELFEQAQLIRDLSLAPPQRVAVMRLLLCIAQAALNGPQDEKRWRTCEDEISAVSLRYLHNHCNSFELFGPQPFMQVGDLETEKSASLDKFDFGLSSGNNATLFDQEATPEGRPHSPAWAALHLLTFLNFSPGGLVSQAIWQGKKSGKNATAAPCIRVTHTFMRSSTLLKTIHFNLLTRHYVEVESHREWGQPVWEVFPKSPDDQQAFANAARTYLGRLVPLSRLVKLTPRSDGQVEAQCILGPSPKGLEFNQPPPTFREPSTTITITKDRQEEKHDYLRLSVDKHIWRELGSVLALSQSMENVGGPPALARLIQSAEELVDEKVDVWVGGLVADRQAFEDMIEWNLYIPVNLLGQTSLNHYQAGVSLADQGEGCLKLAIYRYLAEFKAYMGKDKKSQEILRGVQQRGAITYWQSLDQQYEVLFKYLSTLDSWRKIIIHAIRDAYSQSCPHTTPRQIQAFAHGLRVLHLKGGEQPKEQEVPA